MRNWPRLHRNKPKPKPKPNNIIAIKKIVLVSFLARSKRNLTTNYKIKLIKGPGKILIKSNHRMWISSR